MLFSVVVYQLSTHEIRRSYRPPRPNGTSEFINDTLTSSALYQWRQEQIVDSQRRLMMQLAIFNAFVLSTGAVGSYLLARHTLRPIEESYDSQLRFSSDAAHELRTPLTIMQSEIEVGLRSPRSTKSSHAKLLASNLDEVQRMRLLTDRLLMLANNQDMSILPTSIEDTAIDAVGRVVPLAQTKKITIKNTIGPGMVLANHDSIVDLLIILLDNAIKYSPSHTVITLSARTRGRHIEVKVIDNGPGVSPSDLPRIFDRFYRSDTSRSSQNVAGNGLGLSIAQQIVRSNHGRLMASNNSDTAGATFTFTLPLARPSATSKKRLS